MSEGGAIEDKRESTTREQQVSSSLLSPPSTPVINREERQRDRIGDRTHIHDGC